MMSKHHIRDMFWDYLEGRLSGDKEIYFNEHLDQCHECKMSWLNFKSTVQIIEEEKNQVANPFFSQKVMNAISARETDSNDISSWLTIIKPVAAAAMIVGGIMIGVLLGYRSDYPVLNDNEQKIEAFSESFYFNISEDGTELSNLEEYEN